MRLYSFIIFLAFISSMSSRRIDKYGMLRPPPADNIDHYKLKDVKEEWFTQNLDHFNPTKTNTFQQRYFSSGDNAKEGGPVFLFLNGEGEANILWMTRGAWIFYAKTYGAYCFMLEHRYYGATRPTSDLSTENMEYLSSEQALADTAYFIKGMNKKHNFSKPTKWIIFGGSYAGNLAAWSRLKYPHLIHGSVSTSGPVLAQLDFKEYFEVVTKSLQTYGNNCTNAIKTAVRRIKKLMNTSAGRNELYTNLNLCEPLNIKEKGDVASFMETLADNIAVVVQYNDNYFTNITGACDCMTNKTIGNTFKRFCHLMELLNNNQCIDFKYSDEINALMNTSWDAPTDGERQWFYQTCTEFGYYATSNKQMDLFGDSFKIDFFVKICTDVFGKEFNKTALKQAVERSNIIYGGLRIEESRVVYVHGSVDPWHALGITKSLSQSAPAILINGTSHCTNMYYPRETDPPQLTKAREQISSLIGQWLEE